MESPSDIALLRQSHYKFLASIQGTFKKLLKIKMPVKSFIFIRGAMSCWRNQRTVNSGEELPILMCGTSPVIVKIINVMTKLNGFPSRLTGKTFLRNIMPVTLDQTNDTAHPPWDLSEMPTFLSSYVSQYYGKATLMMPLFQNYL